MKFPLHDGPVVFGNGILGPLQFNDSQRLICYEAAGSFTLAKAQSHNLYVLVADGPGRNLIFVRAVDLDYYPSRKERGEE